MVNRTYAFATRVVAAVGWLDGALAGQVAEHGRRGTVVVGGGRAVDEAKLIGILASLRREGLDEPVVCSGIGPDGHLDGLRRAAGSIPADVDWILAIGGGSVIDAAKLLALHRDGRPLLGDIESLAGLAEQAGGAEQRPVLAVPTCFGSGAEVSPLAEVIDDRGWKEPLVDPALAPARAWIDPDFTGTPPAQVQAAAIVDLFFNLFDPLISAGEAEQPQDRVTVALCRQVVELTRRGTGLRFEGADALELARLGHLAVQPGSIRPWTSSVLHRIEHVVSPRWGLAHGAGLACLSGAFLRRAAARGPAVARRLVALTASIFGREGRPDRLVEDWLTHLPLAKAVPSHGDVEAVTDSVLAAYGRDGQLPGRLALSRTDVRTILEDALGDEIPSASPRRRVEAWRPDAGKLFGGPVSGPWDWLLVTPLPFVRPALARSGTWRSGWFPTLVVEGDARGLVVQPTPGGDPLLDVLTMLERADARFRVIRFVGLCGALDPSWPVGTRVRPGRAWGDLAFRARFGDAPIPLEVGAPDPGLHHGTCGSVSGLAGETSNLLEGWRAAGVDVVDLETAFVAHYGQRTGVPVIADLVVSDHPWTGAPLWASGSLPTIARERAVELVECHFHATVVGGSSSHA